MTDTIRSGLNNVRLGLAAGTTITGTNTTLPGNLTIPGSAAIAGSLTVSNIQPASSVTGVLIANALFGGSPAVIHDWQHRWKCDIHSIAASRWYHVEERVKWFLHRHAALCCISLRCLQRHCGGYFHFTMYPAIRIP